MSKTYLITTAVPGQAVSREKLKTLEKMARHLRAEIKIICTGGITRNAALDAEIPERYLCYSKLNLNKNLILNGALHLSPTMSDPVAGFAKWTRTEDSVIVPSPKQRFKVVPNHSITPRTLMSPGAITEPQYIEGTKAGLFAATDHVMGALIVEIESAQVFHVRQLQFNLRDHSVIDIRGNATMATRYFPNGTRRKEQPEAITLGDIHSSEADPVIMNITKQMLRTLKPKKLFLHDVLDWNNGESHHEVSAIIRRAQKVSEGYSVSKELDVTARLVKELASLASKTFIVRSNHDDHLGQWLEEGRYTTPNQNFQIGHELAMVKFDGKDPFEYALRKRGVGRTVEFLSRTTEEKIAGIEMSKHGDKGASGTRGSPTGMLLTLGRSVTGHTHTPEILGGSYVVGVCMNVSAENTADYAKGSASGWLNTHCVVYKDGSRQLITIINGKWKK